MKALSSPNMSLTTLNLNYERIWQPSYKTGAEMIWQPLYKTGAAPGVSTRGATRPNSGDTPG